MDRGSPWPGITQYGISIASDPVHVSATQEILSSAFGIRRLHNPRLPSRWTAGADVEATESIEVYHKMEGRSAPMRFIFGGLGLVSRLAS